MNGGDLLGKEGRKALNACVKVKIFGRPQTRLYDYNTTRTRFWKCFAGNFPDREPWEYFWHREPEEMPFLTKGKVLELLLPSREDRGIIDIHKSLDDFDDILYVEKYPAEGTDDKLRNLIDRRRKDVEREVREATENPDERHRYSWLVAQRRVRDCFAGTFAGDASSLPENIYVKNNTYSVSDIYESFIKHDSASFVNNFEKYLKRCETCKMCEEVRKQRADIDREYAETVSGTAIYQKRCKYSREEAEKRIRGCCCGRFGCTAMNRDIHFFYMETRPYDIFYICRKLCQIDNKKCNQQYSQTCYGSVLSNHVLFEKYPSHEPGALELKALIDAHRTDLQKEYQEGKVNNTKHRYTRSEAERRVRDCFAGSFVCDCGVVMGQGDTHTFIAFYIMPFIN